MENFGIGPAKGGSMGARGRPAIRRDRPDFARRSIYCEGGLFYFVRKSILAGFVAKAQQYVFVTNTTVDFFKFNYSLNQKNEYLFRQGTNMECQGRPAEYP